MKKRVVFVAMFGVTALCASETVLWPGKESVFRALPESTMERRADGAVSVTTGTSYAWPGMKLDFTAGERDLSSYGRIDIALSNETRRPLTVHLSVKGRTQQGATPGGSVCLPPKAEGVLRVDLFNVPWRIDGPLALVGMRGAPSDKTNTTTFDLRRTYSMHVFLMQDGVERRFAIRRISVSGSGVVQKVMPANTFCPFVDRFGQFAHDEWPGKVADEAGLKAARVREEAWLNAHAKSPIPDRNRFGGWAAGPRLKATGFFRTEKVDGRWWLVDPEGCLFFSHGIDCVLASTPTGISHREKYFSWLPEKTDAAYASCWNRVGWTAPHGFYKDPARVPYETFDFARANLIRLDGAAWAEAERRRAHARLCAWGFNTIANWSDNRLCEMRQTPYTARFDTHGPVIEGSSGWWGKLRDPFAPEFAASLKRRAAAEAARSGRDPWCIGWFVDNELSWGSDATAIGFAVLASPRTQPAKKAAHAWLKRKYGEVTSLNAAWGTAYDSWEALLSATNRPDAKRAASDMADLHRLVVGTYFRTVRDAVKAVAPDRLYLGSRIAWGADVIYEECARYCDVVSVNMYARQPYRDLPETAVDRPMLNGEFHFGALDRGMFHTGLVATRDQAERAACYEQFVNACLDHPRYVGTHWFQWRDQALTGRFDGENYQIGFVSVTDQAYPEMVAAAQRVAEKMYSRRYGRPSAGVPVGRKARDGVK